MPEFNDPQLPDPDEPAVPPDRPAPAFDATRDCRLYVPNPEGWQARVKQGWEKLYCYSKFAGEDHFHLILNGELFLESAEEKLCLTCALRRGLLTLDRLYWQHTPRQAAPRDL